MVTLLTGENSYEIDRELKRLVDAFDGTPEKFDGEALEVRQLPDLLAGMSLFAEKRLVVIKDISSNKQVWDELPAFLERISDDIDLVLIESKPDKRTKTYKALQKAAVVREYKPWTERDRAGAEKWVGEQAAEYGIKFTSALSRLLVARVGVDQWQLAHALDKLSVLGEVNEAIIRDVIEANPSENIFELFETALKGDRARIREMIATLSLTEEPYQLFGLLSGQAFQLAALAAASDSDNVAKDIGAHPFVLSKLKPYAKKEGIPGVSRIAKAFTEADRAMKTSSIDPWLAIERALLQVAVK